MYVSMFRHDRSASPTVRVTGHAAQVGITDATPAGSTTATPAARAVPPGLQGLSQVRRHPNEVTELRAHGISYATFVWPEDHREALEMNHAHIRLDSNILGSREALDYVMQTIHNGWAGRPVLHTFERTTAALRHNLEGRDMHERAMQTFVNCRAEAEMLHTRYAAFSADATQLLINRVSQGAGPATAAPATLLRIAESVWPTLRFSSAEEKNAWVARTVHNPQPFVAQSYDALSLALGRVGADLTEAISNVRETGRDRGSKERDSIMDTVGRAARAYVAAREAFERINIPIAPTTLKGHSVLAVYSMPFF